jgi:hypothetical protein
VLLERARPGAQAPVLPGPAQLERVLPELALRELELQPVRARHRLPEPAAQPEWRPAVRAA